MTTAEQLALLRVWIAACYARDPNQKFALLGKNPYEEIVKLETAIPPGKFAAILEALVAHAQGHGAGFQQLLRTLYDPNGDFDAVFTGKVLEVAASRQLEVNLLLVLEAMVGVPGWHLIVIAKLFELPA